MAVTPATLRELLDLPADAAAADILAATRRAVGLDYVTVTDVELITVGIEWPTAGGPGPHGSTTVTLEHLVDIMVAANDDPLIRHPRVKLGHQPWELSPDGVDAIHDDWDPFWQGTPAFGTVRSLRLDDDGGRLIGDLTEVPSWIADAAPSAWPNRSCEWTFDVQTEAGKRYSAVLTAVALLGVQQQAIKDLTDLQRLLVQGPDNQ